MEAGRLPWRQSCSQQFNAFVDVVKAYPLKLSPKDFPP
jgi:hypothetical protein